MNRIVLATCLALAPLVPTQAARARTPEQAQAIVANFNRVWGGAFTRDELAKVLSDDFIEHHPTSGTPERTKAEFVAHFGRDPATPPRKPGPGMPPPAAVLATGDRVMLMGRRELHWPDDATRTYEAFAFDLYRLDATGRIAEHWDSWTLADKPPVPPAK